jgi:hypothetical protein
MYPAWPTVPIRFMRRTNKVKPKPASLENQETEYCRVCWNGSIPKPQPLSKDRHPKFRPIIMEVLAELVTLSRREGNSRTEKVLIDVGLWPAGRITG